MEHEDSEELRAEISAVNHRMCIFREEVLAELRACRVAAEFCRTFLLVAAVLILVFLLLKPDPTRGGEIFGWIFSWLMMVISMAWKWKDWLLWLGLLLIAWEWGRDIYRSRHSQPQGKTVD